MGSRSYKVDNTFYISGTDAKSLILRSGHSG